MFAIHALYSGFPITSQEYLPTPPGSRKHRVQFRATHPYFELTEFLVFAMCNIKLSHRLAILNTLGRYADTGFSR